MRGRYFFVVGLISAALLLVSGTTRAGETTLTLTSAGDLVDSGIYVGPYTAKITGGSTIQIICDNYDTPASSIPWSATLITFPTTSSGIATFANEVKFGDTSKNPNVSRFGTPPSAATVLQDYEAAAWLAQQLMADYDKLKPGSSAANTQLDKQIGDLDFALLAIFSSSARHSAGFDSGALADYNLALSQTYSLGEFSNVEIWTPNPLNASQEYFTMLPSPELPSAILFGTGLLGIGFVTRRMRRNSAIQIQESRL